MWGPGLAESGVVTFFSVLPVSWLPEVWQRTKQLEIFEFSRADSNTSPLYNSRESKMHRRALSILKILPV